VLTADGCANNRFKIRNRIARQDSSKHKAAFASEGRWAL
jgi:hypothetical protein